MGPSINGEQIRLAAFQRIQDQLRSTREAIYQWLDTAIVWHHGERSLGDRLDDDFGRRIESLKTHLSIAGLVEQARDVGHRWDSSIVDLNRRSLIELLNCSYHGKRVTPDYVCWDADPEYGPDSVSKLLHLLEVIRGVITEMISASDCAQISQKCSSVTFLSRRKYPGFDEAVELCLSVPKHKRNLTQICREIAEKHKSNPRTLRAYLVETTELWEKPSSADLRAFRGK